MNLTPEKPIAGILAPLFALRSKDDLGVGDTFTLREFVDWAADYGFGLVQLLPINETGSDNSPYMAVSSIAIEPSTIRTSPEAIPDLSRKAFEKITNKVNLRKLRTGAVNYRAVKPLKLSLLASAFASFSKMHLAKSTSRARRFRAFIKEHAVWIHGYALFRVLMEENGSEQWDKWPPEQATAAAARQWLKARKLAKRRIFEKRMRFYMYVQWIAFTQWLELKAYCDERGVALMGDVPFGVSYYSDDVFSNPEIFDLTWSGGAPPERIFKTDPFTEKWGQNWGVPIYRWDVMRRVTTSHGGGGGYKWCAKYSTSSVLTTYLAFTGFTAFRGGPRKTKPSCLSTRTRRGLERVAGFRVFCRTTIARKRNAMPTAGRARGC